MISNVFYANLRDRVEACKGDERCLARLRPTWNAAREAAESMKKMDAAQPTDDMEAELPKNTVDDMRANWKSSYGIVVHNRLHGISLHEIRQVYKSVLSTSEQLEISSSSAPFITGVEEEGLSATRITFRSHFCALFIFAFFSKAF